MDEEKCEEMNSFSEVKAREIMLEQPTAFQWRHKKQLCRVYPKVEKNTLCIILKIQNPFIEVSVQRKIRQSVDFEALKLRKGPSGRINCI